MSLSRKIVSEGKETGPFTGKIWPIADQGLIVSGVVDQWAGVQFVGDSVNDNTTFANGGEGRLSLPLGSNLSIQNDFKYEYNSYALESAASNPDFAGPRYSYSGAAHLSWRDPSRGLFGIFGGMGSSNYGSFGGTLSADAAFVGGEAQVYLDNITLYAQAGYVDYDTLDSFPMTDGFFVRGVFRWFLENGSRLQLEGSYFDHSFSAPAAAQLTNTEGEIFTVGARYDFDVDLPIAGNTPLFIGYRGTFREDCLEAFDVDDHTIMIGTSYSFSGYRKTVDRQGATLDTPHFNHSCVR